MTRDYTRRNVLRAAAAALAAPAAPSAAAPVVDTHIHLFDPQRFPYHPQATYRPPAAPLAEYSSFVRQAGIDHTVIVHPEPYQDDHRYLEHCFANEPSPGFFKGTCLYDPIAPATAGRMAELAARNPGRIVALRIHTTRERGVPPTTSGAIRDRDLTHPAVRQTIRAAHKLGLVIQMHMIPVHAPQIHALAAEFPETTFLLDHLARSGFGTPAEFAQVLEMARLRNVWMKFSAVNYSSREPHPHRDTRALVRHVYHSFGPDRMVWGGLGHSMKEYMERREIFEESFQFISEAERAKIRGGNAMRLYWK
jgi:predicted TIM-barrel fold metal-dependent hydrolase